MKITAIQGSPRREGNTATVLSMFEERAAQQGHVVERMNVVDYQVKGCLGCEACHQGRDDELGCVQQDDADVIFNRILGSDVVIYASPLYAWDFSAQLKLLINRHYCLGKNYGSPDFRSLMEGKRTALLVTCGGPVANNADLIQELFDRLNNAYRCDVIGKYILPFCTAPDALGDDARKIAQDMFEDIESN